MIHYTFNSGHSRISPRGEVRDDVIDAMVGLVVSGTHSLPGELGREWKLVVPETSAGLVATLFRGSAPVVTLGVAAAEEEAGCVWPALESFYLGLTDRGPHAGFDWQVPTQPASLPWCAVIVTNPTEATASWVADFERCLAWTWIERGRA